MVYIARLLLSGRQKIALALLVLAAIAFFAYYPRITEALLAFLLGGVVPGTNVILSPDVVLAIVAGVLGAGFIILCLRLYFGARHRSRQFIQIPVTAPSNVKKVPVIDASATSGSEEVPVTGKRTALPLTKRTAKVTTIVMARTASGLYRSWLLARKIGGTTKAAAVKVFQVGSDVAITILGLVWLGSRAIVVLIYRGAKALGAMSVQFARLTWKLSNPYLRRFDSWLEVQVRKFEGFTAGRLGRRESVQTMAAIGREYRKVVHDYHPKAMVQHTKQKITQIKSKVTPTAER